MLGRKKEGLKGEVNPGLKQMLEEEGRESLCWFFYCSVSVSGFLGGRKGGGREKGGGVEANSSGEPGCCWLAWAPCCFYCSASTFLILGGRKGGGKGKKRGEGGRVRIERLRQTLLFGQISRA